MSKFSNRSLRPLATLLLPIAFACSQEEASAPPEPEPSTATAQFLREIPPGLIGEWQQQGETHGDTPQPVSFLFTAETVTTRYAGMRTDGELWEQTGEASDVRYFAERGLLGVYSTTRSIAFLFALRDGELCTVPTLQNPSDAAARDDGLVRLACYRRVEP